MLPTPYATLYSITPKLEWFAYIEDYLRHGHKDPSKPQHRKRLIEIEAAKYALIEDQLYHTEKDGNLCLCVPKSQYLEFLHHAHAGILGGHFSGPNTAKNILWTGLWWPTLQQDALEFGKRCEHCQCSKPPISHDEMPLGPIMEIRAFEKWGL